MAKARKSARWRGGGGISFAVLFVVLQKEVVISPTAEDELWLQPTKEESVEGGREI